MKANELRIGNLITYHDAIITVEGIVKNCIYHSGLCFDSGIESYQPFEPILLNDLWLLKFGFKLFNDGGELVGNDMFWIHLKMKGSVNHGTYIWNVCGVKIRYVHQLQNLFFTLVGVELQLTAP